MVQRALGLSAATPLANSRRAWGWVMVGPIILWFLHLSLMYALVQPVCARGGSWAFHVVSVVLLGAALLTGLLAWRIRQTPIDPVLSPAIPPARKFAGTFGTFVSALVSLAILAQWYPVFVIGPCG